MYLLMCFQMLLTTNEDVLRNVHAALFHTNKAEAVKLQKGQNNTIEIPLKQSMTHIPGFLKHILWGTDFFEAQMRLLDEQETMRFVNK